MELALCTNATIANE